MTIKPIWVGCASTMILVDVFIFALFHAANARWLKTPPHPATQPTTYPPTTVPKATTNTQAPITRDNPGRTFEVMTTHLLCKRWTKGDRFSEYSLRRQSPAPAPNPGADPVTSTNDYYEDAISGWLNTDPPIVRVVQDGVCSISEQQLATFKQLRDSFERLALQSKGLFYVIVERQYAPLTPEHGNDHTPPVGELNGPHRRHFSSTILPGDPTWIRRPTDDELKIVPTEPNDHFVQNSAGDVIGVIEPGVQRQGYIYGDVDVKEQFVNLANAAGRAMFQVPDTALPLLPKSVRQFCGSLENPTRQPDNSISVRIGANSDAIGCHPSDFWAIILHHMGWEADSTETLQSDRYFWSGRTSVSVKIAPGAWMTPPVPRHRFYSVLGKGERTDVIWASVWALDRIIQLVS
jgi:hypothetical protein